MSATLFFLLLFLLGAAASAEPSTLLLLDKVPQTLLQLLRAGGGAMGVASG